MKPESAKVLDEVWDRYGEWLEMDPDESIGMMIEILCTMVVNQKEQIRILEQEINSLKGKSWNR